MEKMGSLGELGGLSFPKSTDGALAGSQREHPLDNAKNLWYNTDMNITHNTPPTFAQAPTGFYDCGYGFWTYSRRAVRNGFAGWAFTFRKDNK